MKLLPVYFLLFVLSLFTCRSANKIETAITPIETYQTQIVADTNCASIISNNFVIAVEEFKKEKLEELLITNNFIKKNNNFQILRIPKLIFFKIMIENTGEIPLNIEEVKFQYNNTFSNPLNAEEIQNKYNSLPHSDLNFDEIFSLFKFDAEDLCGYNIEFSGDIIKNKGPILSGVKVFQIVAFNWVPIEIRKFNLSIVIKSDIIKKIIDFKLMRLEYRQSGKYFIKPETDDNNSK